MSTATELKKTLLILLCSFMLLQTVSAKHIAGGEMRYTYLGPGFDANTGSYRISLRLYRDCNAPVGSANLQQVVDITIYQNGVSTVYKQLQVYMSQYDINSLSDPGPCINNPPAVCYEVGTYTVELDLPLTANGYTIAHQGCCRIGSISNVIGSSVAGYTYVATIPGTAITPLASRNSSPVLDMSVFRHNTAFTCSNLAAMINYAATYAVAFLLSLYLQYIKMLGPETAGLILIAQPVVQVIFSPSAGRLSDRIEPRMIASIGMALTAAGLLTLSLLAPETPVWSIVALLLILGLGYALFSSPNTNAIMSSVDRRHYGVASSMVATMRALGQLMSMAIAMMIFSVVMGRVQVVPGVYPEFLTSVRLIFLVLGILAILGIYASYARGKIRGNNQVTDSG